MLKKSVLACVLAGGLASMALGDVISEDGKYKGAEITGDNLTKLTAVLDEMEELGDFEGDDEVKNCAKCLKEMLKHHRICLETGTHDSAASTWSGKEAGKCGDAKDGMHIGAKSFKLSNKHLMAVLAHEWKHTTQSMCDPRAEREVEGYECGKKLLALCGETTGDTVDWYDKKIAAWQAKVDTGKGGAKSGVDSDNPPAQYDVFTGESNLWVGTPDQPLQMVVPLQRQNGVNPIDPNDLFLYESDLLPAGSTVVIVLGFDPIDDAGVLQYYDVNFGAGQAQLLLEHVLPGVDPFTGELVIDLNDPAGNRLYVLDPLGGQVLLLEPPLGDPVGLPFELNPFPFLPPGSDPKLNSAQEIGPGAQPDSIRLFDGDARGDDLGLFTESIVEAVDTDGDGQADVILPIEQNTQIRLLPALDKNPPEAGDGVVVVGGTPGGTLELRSTNADGTQVFEVFGQIQPESDYLVEFPLPRDLVLGEFVQVVDLDDADIDLHLTPYLVVPCAADLTGNGTVDSDDFFEFLNLFAMGDPAADFTGDGVIDSLDFFAFLDEFQRCIT